MREFWERGYHETSVEDLVAATGLRPGSLYNAFPGGKRSLFLQTLLRIASAYGDVVPFRLVAGGTFFLESMSDCGVNLGQVFFTARRAGEISLVKYLLCREERK